MTEFLPKRALSNSNPNGLGQARNPNTTYNEYEMDFWKFA